MLLKRSRVNGNTLLMPKGTLRIPGLGSCIAADEVVAAPGFSPRGDTVMSEKFL